MKKNQSLKTIGIIVAVAAVYFVLSLPFAHLVFAAGTAELRFSGFIPMVAGLMFGPAGALGCAVGNFLIDATHTFDITDAFGTAGVFLMAYLPYRLWHSLFRSSGNKTAAPVFFDSVTSVLKYVLIAMIAAICASAVPAVGGQLSGHYSFAAFFPQVALQYFDLSLLFGMLLFQLLTCHAKIKPHIPAKVYGLEYRPVQYLADYILLFTAAALSAALLVLTGHDYFQSREYIKDPEISILCILLLCVIAVLAFLPIARSRVKKEDAPEYRPEGGLQKQFITGFLSLLCAVLISYIATMLLHMEETGETGAVFWLYILTNVACASVLMVAILSLLLKWIEKHVTHPLRRVSEYAENFVKDDELTEKDLLLGKSGNEIDELGESVRSMTDNIRGYVRELKEKTAAEERFAAEMNVARGIQMSLLPEYWESSSFDIAAEIKSARAVGGDFYDFCELSGDRLFVAAADVSGKGVSAALFMMRAQTLMKARLDLPVAEMLRQLNEELSDQNSEMMFVTIFAGVIDREAMTFTYVNAGHNPPVVHHKGKTEFLDGCPNFVVGPMPETEYTEHTITISDDFKLLLYTDGVTEAQDGSSHFYGGERLRQVAQTAFSMDLSAREIVDTVKNDVDTFVNETEQTDDITLLCVSLDRID